MSQARGNLVRISAANITIDYDLVFDCKAEVKAGYGIASATPTAQEVVEGDSCVFTAVEQTGDWIFEGWYDNSDFTGTPESTQNPYTKTNITQDTILYPKGKPGYKIQVFGDSNRFTYTLNKTTAVEGETITLTTSSKNSSLYKFADIYEADANGNRTSTILSTTANYTFTMPAHSVYIYVAYGKDVKIYVTCQNCSLSGETSPITVTGGSTKTISFTNDQTTTDWVGIYSDANFTNRLTTAQQYDLQLGESDMYIYAKAILKQQIYVKENGTWVGYSKVYVKENGNWVQKDDFSNIFDTNKKYKRIEL